MDGTTKEHALLAFTIGVKQIIVAVNKMNDANVNYSEVRYLDSIGFKKGEIHFIPISGWKDITSKRNLPIFLGLPETLFAELLMPSSHQRDPSRSLSDFPSSQFWLSRELVPSL